MSSQAETIARASDAEIQDMLAECRAALRRARRRTTATCPPLRPSRRDRDRRDGDGDRDAQGGEPAGIRARHVASWGGRSCSVEARLATMRAKKHGPPAERFPPHGGRGIRHQQAAGPCGEAGHRTRLQEFPDRRRRLAPLREANRVDEILEYMQTRCCSSSPMSATQASARRRHAPRRRRLSGHGRARDALPAAQDREDRSPASIAISR